MKNSLKANIRSFSSLQYTRDLVLRILEKSKKEQNDFLKNL